MFSKFLQSLFVVHIDDECWQVFYFRFDVFKTGFRDISEIRGYANH